MAEIMDHRFKIIFKRMHLSLTLTSCVRARNFTVCYVRCIDVHSREKQTSFVYWQLGRKLLMEQKTATIHERVRSIPVE